MRPFSAADFEPDVVDSRDARAMDAEHLRLEWSNLKALCASHHRIAEAEVRAATSVPTQPRGGIESLPGSAAATMTRDRPPEDEEDSSDPLAPVRLTHAKATLSSPGARLVWRPETCEHGVYLRAVSQEEEATTEARKLLGYLRGRPAGVSSSELHKNPPAGLGRAATKAALERLVGKGLVTATEEERGRNRALATVYRASEGA